MPQSLALPALTALRYVQPLREGGSLPAIVDTEGGLFVVKFRGAGQGAKALVAELIVGLLAQRLDLPVPDLALIDVPESFGRNEPDSEIRDVLRKSHGTNVGLRYLDGAFNYDATAARGVVPPDVMARIVWLDALTTNPDRTARNTNMLVWQRAAWLIDHGAALYSHHDWASLREDRARLPFALIRDHVLLVAGDDPLSVDAEMSARLDRDSITEVVAAVPDELLIDEAYRADGVTPAVARERYASYLTARLAASHDIAAAASEARGERRIERPVRRTARR